jgi:predicted metal-dependent peptidase
LARLVSDLVKPRVDWRSVLRRFLSTRAKVDLSYARPKRRFLADDLYLPSLNGERMGKIAIGVDCSGSINEKTLALFSAEIQAIAEDIRPESIEVIYFDSEVISRESFGPEERVELKPMGGGGTAFSPVFECLKDSDIVACVVLTDLDCNDFGDPPSFPVLWASTHSDSAPFGEITLIKGDL